MAKKILLLNGPNLNMLGKRDPKLYGDITLKDVEETCEKLAEQNGIQLESKQTNYEGELVEFIHAARETSEAIIINPGAYSHTSVAIFDALEMFQGPIVEVHISNIHKRENFRKTSVIKNVCIGQFFGEGKQSYINGIKHILEIKKWE